MPSASQAAALLCYALLCVLLSCARPRPQALTVPSHSASADLSLTDDTVFWMPGICVCQLAPAYTPRSRRTFPGKASECQSMLRDVIHKHVVHAGGKARYTIIRVVEHSNTSHRGIVCACVRKCAHRLAACTNL